MNDRARETERPHLSLPGDVEIPALLVPGGSRSALCRARPLCNLAIADDAASNTLDPKDTGAIQ
jgi:hypothetical protein